MLRPSSYNYNPATRRRRLKRALVIRTTTRHGRPRGRKPRVTLALRVHR